MFDENTGDENDTSGQGDTGSLGDLALRTGGEIIHVPNRTFKPNGALGLVIIRVFQPFLFQHPSNPSKYANLTKNQLINQNFLVLDNIGGAKRTSNARRNFHRRRSKHEKPATRHRWPSGIVIPRNSKWFVIQKTLFLI